jgi:hypothetical protein
MNLEAIGSFNCDVQYLADFVGGESLINQFYHFHPNAYPKNSKVICMHGLPKKKDPTFSSSAAIAFLPGLDYIWHRMSF